MDEKRLLEVLEGMHEGSLHKVNRTEDDWLNGFHAGRMHVCEIIIELIKGVERMITVGSFLSYAAPNTLVMRYNTQTKEFEGLYSVDDFVNVYCERKIDWFDITNSGYLVIVLEGEK